MVRLLLIVLTTLWTNLANPVFVRVDTRGLPEQAAMTLAQDASGFMWVGTQGGLARFDGYRFRNFLPNPSDPNALPDGYVRALLPDASGLWIGTSTTGLAYFDERTERFRSWRPDPSGRMGPHSGEIAAILRADHGSLWIGGDGGLDRYDPQTGRFTEAKWPTGMETPVVWSLLLDHDGTLWAGTQDGLFERPRGSAQFRRSAVPDALAIYSLYEDSAEGRLWAGSVSKVWVLDHNRHSARALISDPANPATLAPGQQWSIIEARPGVIWAGTDNTISVIDERSGAARRIVADSNDPSGLAAGRVVQFLRDRSGLIWIADHVGGLLIDNPRSHGLEHLSSARPEIGPNINGGTLAVAITQQGTLWQGGLDGKLDALDPRNGRARMTTLRNRAAIQTLLAEPDGTLWIGTTSGLCRLNVGAAEPLCPAGPSAVGNESIYTLADDGKRLWVGGSNGLFIADRSGNVTHLGHGNDSRSLPNDQVRALLLDRHGSMWIGTENGLDRYDRGGTLVHFSFDPRNSNSIGAGGVTTIAQDREGRIWVGANGGPLNIITETNGRATIRHLGVADGMPHENVDGLAEDSHGAMWASTDKGLGVIDERTLAVRSLGVSDGVSDAGFWAGAVTESHDGTICFGGLDGVTIVEPGADSRWTYRPPIVVTALEAGRRGVPAGAINIDSSTVHLPESSRTISVEFAALDYSAPQALRYQYRLRGYDRDWVDTDANARTATYTHLPPAHYTLDVRATNRLGAWTATPLHIAFAAAPLWNETWWFRTLVALAVLLIGYAVYRLRTRYLVRLQRELEALVESRTRELSQANEKLHELSVNDPLTGLRNRRFVADHLESEAAITLRRYDAAITSNSPPPFDADILLFLIDLDNFKAVNDRYGHLAGDALLIGVCEVLQETFRGSDFVARWGGDEFLAVARDSQRSDGAEIAERLRSAVAARTYSIGERGTVSETVSIGFSAFPFIPAQPHAVPWSQVVALADQALYAAKNSGRNTWCGVTATDKTARAQMSGGLEGSIQDAAREGLLEILKPDYPIARAPNA